MYIIYIIYILNIVYKYVKHTFCVNRAHECGSAHLITRFFTVSRNVNKRKVSYWSIYKIHHNQCSDWSIDTGFIVWTCFILETLVLKVRKLYF